MADFNEEFNKVMDTKDTTNEFDTQDIKDNKVWAILACFGILFFLPLIAAPQSKYAKFYANQGFILFLFGIVCGIVNAICGLIPVVGTIVGIVIWLIELLLFIFALVNAANGKAKELPVIGGLLHVFDK